MTLIMALANSQQAIQISDRRLTCNGKVTDDSSNKATVLVCANGRFAVGYAGLAYSGRFQTQPWILDSLCECGSPEFGIGELTGRLMHKANRDFAHHPDLRSLDPKIKRLTIMFTGYLYQPKPLVANIMMTNFQDWTAGTDRSEASPDFWACWQLQHEHVTKPSLLQRVGAWTSIPSEELDQVRTMLAEHRPAHGIVEKGCAMIRKAADRRSAANTVGKDVMSVVLPSERDREISTSFKPFNGVDVAVLPDQATVLPARIIAIRNVTFAPLIRLPGRPFVRPRPHKNRRTKGTS